jgi:hypothetical protein
MSGRALARRAATPGLLVLGALLTWPAGSAGAQATPSLTLTPSSGAVGSTIQVVGMGFCGTAGCSSVRLTFAGIVVADGIGVGSDNRFAITVVVPGGLKPGGQAVAATQTTSAGQQRAATGTFQVVTRSAAPTGSPSPTLSGSASPSPLASPPVSLSPAAGGGTSPGVIWAMVAAGAVFLAAVAGMLYIVWRSREVHLPPPPGPVPPDRPAPPVLTHGAPPEQAALESVLGRDPHEGHLEPGPARPHPGDDETTG